MSCLQAALLDSSDSRVVGINKTPNCNDLGVVPQSGEKQIFYCTVYYITLNSNCEAQRSSKNSKKIVEDRVRSQK